MLHERPLQVNTFLSLVFLFSLWDRPALMNNALVHPSIQTSILNRLGDMLRLNPLAAFDIGNGPGHFENPVVRPSRKPQPVHGLFH